MKVYLLTRGYESSIGGIFSTREKAQEYIAKCAASPDTCYYTDWNEIQERELDAELAEAEHQVYTCTLIMSDGSTCDKEPAGARLWWGIPYSRADVVRDVPYLGSIDIIRSWSCKSASHAMKLAVECRQKELRKKG